MCGEDPENEWHLFFGCSKAQQVWEAIGLWDQIGPDFEEAEGANELFFKLLEHLQTDAQTDLAAGIWCFWRRRNDKAWNSSEKLVVVVVHDAKSFLQAWLIHNRTSSSQPLQVCILQQQKISSVGTLQPGDV